MKRVVVLGAGLATVAVVAFLAAACGGAGTPGEPRPTLPYQAKASFAKAGEPLNGRSYLSLCVDDGTGGASDGAVETVEEALEGALAAEVELPSQYDLRVVTAGCPAPGASLGTPTSEYDIRQRGVDVPSDHIVFVYLLDPALYTATFGDDLYARGGGEMVCRVDVCFGVTYALYISASVSEELLQTALADSLGLLLLRYSNEAIFRTACERGEAPTVGFDCSDYDEWLR